MLYTNHCAYWDRYVLGLGSGFVSDTTPQLWKKHIVTDVGNVKHLLHIISFDGIP